MSTQYKYKTSIVIGHSPDGKPIRKYIQDNSKMRFDAKVRQVRALTERGGAPGKTTVEEWGVAVVPQLQSAARRRVPAHQLPNAHPAAHHSDARRAPDRGREALSGAAAAQ